METTKEPNKPSHNKNKRKAGKKRRRTHADDEEQRQSYCDRLLHSCRKDLHKNAKIAKNFWCQKIIRKLKEHKKKNGETQLQTWRELPLEPVVEECFRRLGVLDLLENNNSKDGNSNNTETKPSTADNQTQQTKEQNLNDKETVDSNAMERILQHKRMREALEAWSLKVTEYRKWCARNLSLYASDDNNDSDHETRRKRKTNPAKRKRKQSGKGANANPDEGPVDSSHSLFMTLNDNDDEQDGNPRPKKNRAGQKARRAKALALEAKKHGRTVDQSSNWREASSKRRAEETPVEPAAAEKEEKELHPSWEASKTKQSGIVAFKGKKITF